MSRFYFALDLRDDPMLIREYESSHKADAIWSSVIQLLRDSGVQELELYRWENRLLQVLEVRQGHPLVAGRSTTTIAPSEELMWRYQQPLPLAQPGEKWVRMNRLFLLKRIALRSTEKADDRQPTTRRTDGISHT